MEYKRGMAGKEVGIGSGHMNDFQSAAETVVVERAVPRNGLGLASFGLSTLLIGVLSIGFCVTLWCLAVLGLDMILGRDGASDLMTQLRFDPALRTRVSAVTLSGIYVGVASATLATAWIVGRNRWRRQLALCPIKPGRGRTLILAIATLSYAASITLAIQLWQNHYLQDSGPTDTVLLALLLLNICVLAPAAEELFFRGWLYTALRERMPFWFSYLVTAGLFAAIHWYASPAHMLKVLPLAIVLGLVREWKDSIKPTIALHAAYNLTIVLITLVGL